jgi:16S rRNA (cytidine1402-2'-O)-methyltransferase
MLYNNLRGLYVVATHIGNWDDITVRALEILKNVDFVISEEYKNGSRLLKHYGISKPIELLNEHNESEQSQIIFNKLIQDNSSAAIISDAGTPVFADPGTQLTEMCFKNNVKVTPVPGASSLMSAIMGAGIKMDKFLFNGFLPANRDERIKALKKIKNLSDYNIIFLEAPYRLKQFLRDLIAVLGPRQNAVLAYKLTQPEEKFFWGTLGEMKTMTENLPKGEFVFILKRSNFNKKTYRKK